MLKISLFHVVSRLRTEVTMGDLISDQNKSPFYVIDAHTNLQNLQLKFTENELKSCIWSWHDQQSVRKFKSFIQYSVHWFKNIINITFIIHISCKIWIYLKFLVKNCPKTAFQLVFCKLELEHAGWYGHLSLRNVF